MFRIEIWTKFDSSSQNMVTELREHLQNEYIKLMIEDPTTRPISNKIDPSKPEEWLGNFTNNQKDSAPRGPPGGR